MPKLFFSAITFLLCCLMLAPNSSIAQTKKKKDKPSKIKLLENNNPDARSFYLANALSPSNNIKRFYKGEEQLHIRELKNLVQRSPIAMAEYQNFKEAKKMSTLLNIGGAALYLGGIWVYFDALKNSSSNANFLQRSKVAAGMYVGGLVLSGVSISYGLSANRHYNQTLRNYNGDLVGSFK